MAEVEVPRSVESAQFAAKQNADLDYRRMSSDASNNTFVYSKGSSDEQGSGNASDMCAGVLASKENSMLDCAKDKVERRVVKGLDGVLVGQRICAKRFGSAEQVVQSFKQQLVDGQLSRPDALRLSVLVTAELTYGIKESPGYRTKMEDRTSFFSKFMTLKTLAGKNEALIPRSLQAVLQGLTSTSGAQAEECYLLTLPFDFVAVFDGHGGTEVAEALSKSLAQCIKNTFDSKQREIDLGDGVEPSRTLLQGKPDSPSGKAKVGSLSSSVQSLISGWPQRSIVHDSFASRAGSDCGAISMDIDSNIQRTITSVSQDSAGTQCSDEAFKNSQPLSLKNVEEAIEVAFEKFNETLPGVEDKTVGSTAVVSMISAAHVIVANVGDSRAVLRRSGISYRLSRDHKPDQADEEDRIRACGGRVWDFNGRRVMGLLAMTRAFGDDCLQGFGITAKPEVTIVPRTEEDEFLILACDGLWDVVSDDEACELVDRCFRRAEERDAPAVSACRVAASVLFRAAFAKGSNDNISVVVVDLRQDKVDNNE